MKSLKTQTFQQRRRHRQYLRTLLVAGLTVFALWAVNLIWYKPFSIHLFFERMFWEYGLRRPELMTQTRQFDKLATVFKIHYRVNGTAETDLADDMAFITRNFEMLRSYSKTQAGPSQALTADIMDYHLERLIFQQQFPYFRFRLNPLEAPHSQLIALLLHAHAIESLADAEAYLARVAALSERIQYTAHLLTIDQIQEALPAKIFMQLLAQQLEHFCMGRAQNNLLFLDFESKLTQSSHITPEAITELLYEMRIELSENLMPACKALLLLLDELTEQAPENPSYSKLPDGQMYLMFLMEEALTTETNRNALQERCSQFGLLLESLFDTDPKLLPHNEAPANFGQLAEQQLAKLRIWSHRFTGLQTQMPLHLEPAPPTHAPFLGHTLYQPNDLSGKLPAKLYIRMLDPEHLSPSLIHALLLRDAFPGKHFQQAIQRDQEHFPAFRRWVDFKWFSEGWKIYCLLKYAEDPALSPQIRAAIGHLLQLEHLRMQAAIQVHYDEQEIAQTITILAASAPPLMQENHLFSASIMQAIAAPENPVAAIVGSLRWLEMEQLAKSRGVSGKAFRAWALTQGAMPWKVFEREFDRAFPPSEEAQLAQDYSERVSTMSN